MSLPEDSLSGLAALCVQVETTLAAGVPNKDTFDTLQVQINKLQVRCSNHEGVLAARVKWYEFGLDNFEEHLVRAFEERRVVDFTSLVWDVPNKVTPIIMTRDTLLHFLRRSYLKGEFSRIYRRVEALFERIVASGPHGQTWFGESLTRLREDLVDGRL
jgi:hypothetical protein